MKQLVIVLLLCCNSIPFWAQADYKKVREMFAVPHTNIDLSVFKGHLDGVHPVEFFLGHRDTEIHGYYRLVSSGETFILEGEWTNSHLAMSEISSNGNQLGIINASEFNFFDDNEFQLNWNSLVNKDVLVFYLKKAAITDYAPLAFKSSYSKYCDYTIDECFALDIYEKNKGDMIYLASAKKKSITVSSIEPLVFYTSDSIIYEETNAKLRANNKGKLQYFSKENKAEIKRVYYASKNILSDVEFPVFDHEGFNSFLNKIISKEKEITRDEIKNHQKPRILEPEESHFQHKWNGWTEIDYLGTSMISGRIILNRFSYGETNRKVIPFLYDFSEDESSTAIAQFKPDVDIVSFFNNRVGVEMQSNPSIAHLEKSDFKYYSLSDNYVLISTDYDPIHGCSVIKIPYSELKNWMKRNSLIKKIMRT